MNPQIEDIRGLKDLIHIPYPIYYYLIGAILAAVLVALIVWFVRRLLRRKTPDPHSAIPPTPLDQQILKELLDLRTRDDYGPATEKRFHFLLSEIFRRYLEGRFLFAATDSTTEEIISHFSRLLTLTESQKTSLVHVLKQTDEVKFAERHKTCDEAHALIELAEAFIRETTPTEVIPS